MNTQENKAKRGRANGCGTLEKRGKVWRARWVVNGQTFTKSTGTSDKREAEKVLAELVRPTQAGSDKERLENLAARIAGREAEIEAYRDKEAALSVADAFDQYRNHPEAPGSTGAETLAIYESQYGRFTKWLADAYPEVTELRDVSKRVAYDFLRALSESVAPNTYNKYITLFTRIWDVLDEDARLKGANPWRKAAKKATAASDRRELTTAELARIGQTATGEIARLFAIGVYTGLRLGDAVRLDWSHINLTRNHITIEPRKTKRYTLGKPVVIPIVRPFRALLDSIEPADRVGALCAGLRKLYEKDSAAVSNRIQRVFTACGIETTTEARDGGHRRVVVGFHSFRHTFVTIAAENGIPLPIVQAIVGHSSPAMTRHYTHVHEQAVQANFKAFPDVFASAPEQLTDGAEVIEAEAVVVQAPESVELDAVTIQQLDALRGERESRADVLRRALAALAGK